MKKFHILFVRPTRYDQDGYPIHWTRSAMPSNTLAGLYGIAEDCHNRRILGEDVEIVMHPVDESNMRVDHDRMIAMMKQDAGGLLCLVGVQTNQWPRATDMAQRYLAENIPVCIGGFHVAGCMNMLPELPPEIVEAQEQGISIFAGEAEEERLDEVLIDAYAGRLKPLYDHRKDMPGLEQSIVPFIPGKYVKRTHLQISSFDLGRGCPYECSFCCIINVQGRKSRYRTPDDLERIIRRNQEEGVARFFLTDDNFARNRNWEPFLDRLIEIKDSLEIPLKFYIQVDTLCHKIPNFIEKCVQAGVDNVFIGLENINPDNLAAMQKRQNKITEYRKMLLAWKKHPVVVSCGYIIGFPNDTRESILHDIELIKRELPMDILNISILTPIPGSQDHRDLYTRGEWMDPDLNKYDLTYRVTHHPKMSDDELDRTYQDAWDTYYTFDHMKTVLRRMAALGSNKRVTTVDLLTYFGIITKVHGLRSYDMGILRRACRLERRRGMPIESPLVYYPRHWWRNLRAGLRIGLGYRKLYKAMQEIWRDPARDDYMDRAIEPVQDGDFEELSLFTETRGGQDAVAKHRKQKAIKEAARAPTETAKVDAAE